MQAGMGIFIIVLGYQKPYSSWGLHCSYISIEILIVSAEIIDPCHGGLVAAPARPLLLLDDHPIPSLEMATGTYPAGNGHPYLYPYPSLCTCRVTCTRTRVEKCSRTHIRAGKFYPTGNLYPTSYLRITYKYQIFTYKNKSFQASNKLQTNIHIMTSLQYI
jgi:hypothetical protein